MLFIKHAINIKKKFTWFYDLTRTPVFAGPGLIQQVIILKVKQVNNCH
jgi:hypothetical protein